VEKRLEAQPTRVEAEGAVGHRARRSGAHPGPGPAADAVVVASWVAAFRDSLAGRRLWTTRSGAASVRTAAWGPARGGTVGREDSSLADRRAFSSAPRGSWERTTTGAARYLDTAVDSAAATLENSGDQRAREHSARTDAEAVVVVVVDPSRSRCSRLCEIDGRDFFPACARGSTADQGVGSRDRARP
jgi:hypothetical protein